MTSPSARRWRIRQRCNHAVHTEPIWHKKTEHRKMARLRQRSRPVMPARKIQLKRTLLLLEGSPSLHSGNTRPSWLLTNLPSNWRIQHCNHMAQRWSPQVHPRLPVDRGNLCHEPCSTTPFSAPPPFVPVLPPVMPTMPPAPADPYNCADGFANWQAGWSVPKNEWCC